jgi:glycosyltransferase involved in cell wall biosynthesis
MLSVIIPVYNQEKVIEELVNKINHLAVEKEIIVVNDGSVDNTELILRGLSFGGLKVIHHVSNRGKAAALRTGLEHASGEFIFVPNSRLEDKADNYLKLLEAMNASGADIVLGTRLGSVHPGGGVKRARDYFCAKILNILLGVKLQGWFSHFQLVRRASLINLSPQLKGSDISFEIIIKGLRKKMRVVEVLIPND